MLFKMPTHRMEKVQWLCRSVGEESHKPTLEGFLMFLWKAVQKRCLKVNSLYKEKAYFPRLVEAMEDGHQQTSLNLAVGGHWTRKMRECESRQSDGLLGNVGQVVSHVLTPCPKPQGWAGSLVPERSWCFMAPTLDIRSFRSQCQSTFLLASYLTFRANKESYLCIVCFLNGSVGFPLGMCNKIRAQF